MKVHDLARAERQVISDSGVRERRFEALYTAHYHAVAGYVLRRVAAHEADDVIAQVFTVAWRRFDHVPSPPGDLLWLFGVARNGVAYQRRSERRRIRLWARLSQDVMTTGSIAPPTDPSGEQMRAAMSALRPGDREALQLVLWDELSHAEAAAVMGCSPNAFELRYRRARSAVRDALTAMHPGVAIEKERPAGTQKSRTAPS
jgi:RNA polymerase sigma-70 factor (ECF subfamily)